MEITYRIIPSFSIKPIPIIKLLLTLKIILHFRNKHSQNYSLKLKGKEELPIRYDDPVLLFLALLHLYFQYQKIKYQNQTKMRSMYTFTNKNNKHQS